MLLETEEAESSAKVAPGPEREAPPPLSEAELPESVEP